MDLYKIKDEEMYIYFDNLIYGEEDIKSGWKKNNYDYAYGLTNYDVHSILGSKKLFYRSEDAEKQICLLETMQKFLHDYIGIEGLEELLINNYGVIENSIFLEHDSYGNPAHIREHAKHQMKNAFLGSILMLQCGYLSDMARNVYEEAGSITQYLVRQANKVLRDEQKIADGDKTSSNWEDQVLSKLEEWCYEIFMVSSMLHDIGYPLEFYLRSAQQLSDYPPYLKILSPTVKTDFAEIKAHLLGSQLFKLVDNRVIREKYDKNDHGVLSAISLLMHFYYGGRIYALDAEQKCILEMSAIAIYKHTDRFENGFRMVYRKDPISYMVRLCDDLQEWNRFKLQINDKHNYLRCEHCWKILLENDGLYECPGCHKKYRKVTQIENRKVNYISLCDQLEVEKDGGKVKITVSFVPIKQLEMLMDDYTAVVRIEDSLRKVQEFVKDQFLSPEIEINFFLSNNPIRLIEYMIKHKDSSDGKIKKWIAEQSGEKRIKLNKFFNDYLEKKKNNVFGKRIEINDLRYAEKAADYVKKYYGEIYSLHEMLDEE